MATTFPHRTHHTPIHSSTADASHGYGVFQLSRHTPIEQASSEYGGLPYPDAQHHVDHNLLVEQTPTERHNAFADEQHESPDRGNGETTDAMTGHAEFDMLPPSPSTHSSWQALHDYAQTHAAQHGYALSINTTAKNRSRIKLACVCYGQPKNTHKLTAETRVRKNRVSYKTGCRMWVEGKKLNDETWVLNVGEPHHNHPGRPREGWALQRKRTWGDVGGRIGVGGVTAKEELAKLASEGRAVVEVDEEEDGDEHDQQGDQIPNNNIHERGGVVWKIVEQEMERKDGTNQGRDRGVGRTVEVLQARLPGIHIFKRDVYNIRAQIKRARKLAEEQPSNLMYEERLAIPSRPHLEPVLTAEIGDRDDEDDQKDEAQGEPVSVSRESAHMFIASGDNKVAPDPPFPSRRVFSASELEVVQLKKEIVQLKALLTETRKALKEKTIENTSLRTQADFARNMAMLPS